ncbi:MAG TPA: PrsW family glutamic-type intramembrane protease [Candidatus Paceibacterota bacterium]|nr:PrsW family glutamic-type intramembrane protease [Candidatus Paceibacterota bacterium]
MLSSYALLIGIGLTPSLIWLAYWLRKDCHPEPKVLITKVLLLGIILSPLAIAAQLLFVQAASDLFGLNADAFSDSSWFFLGAALIEETVKWLAVWFIVLRNPEFDEPVDAMIYMLTAAMGFAAMENILVINRVIGDGVTATVGIWGLRFAGATLLHALSSALLGYFIALSWFAYRHRQKLFWTGLALATVFHWVFNMFISQMQHSLSLMFSTLLLIVMAFLISALFDKIKERDGAIRANVC